MPSRENRAVQPVFKRALYKKERFLMLRAAYMLYPRQLLHHGVRLNLLFPDLIRRV